MWSSCLSHTVPLSLPPSPSAASISPSTSLLLIRLGLACVFTTAHMANTHTRTTHWQISSLGWTGQETPGKNSQKRTRNNKPSVQAV